MNDLNAQFAEMQKNLEPIQQFNNVAAEAFERIARKNYALMGDLMEYAVAQVQVPVGKTNPQEIYEEQINQARAFAEKVNSRASEYVELAGELGEMVTTSSEEVTAQVAAKKPATRKAKKNA